MIRENLSGKRIAITGSTGFLGTALVERFLRSVPDCELVLLVRPGRRGAEHAPSVRCSVLERRHGLVEMISAYLGASVLQDASRVLWADVFATRRGCVASIRRQR